MRIALRPFTRFARPTYIRTLATASSVVPPDAKFPLSEEHKAAVFATAPILAEHGLTITKEMYRTMLSNNPALRDIFSHTAQLTGQQALALAQSVHGYAANIHDLTPLLPTVVRIAEKHAALGVKPEHYAVVGENLMGAIKTVLGDAFTAPLQEAWYNAYWQLAKIFIDAEAGLYSSAAWSGWKDFKITKHVDESGEISSLTLVPTDKSMLPLKPYKPGQFITVRVWIDELNCYQNRHYSLSDAYSPDEYRVTIKREDSENGSPQGIVSTAMHSLKVGSTVQCAFPTGSFTIPSPLPENIVLISGGVGVTPNLSILNTVAKDNSVNISWLQAVLAPEEHVFKSHVADLVSKSNGKIQSAAFYAEGGAKEPNTYNGLLIVDEVDRSLLKLDDPKAIYYVCGPDGFMAATVNGLENAGVDASRISVEAFRSGEVETDV